MSRALLLCIALALAGCGTPVPAERVITVQVPVRVPCIDRAPERPAFQIGRGEYPGDKDAARMLAEDFEAAERYGVAWEAAAAGCFVVPPPAR